MRGGFNSSNTSTLTHLEPFNDPNHLDTTAFQVHQVAESPDGFPPLKPNTMVQTRDYDRIVQKLSTKVKERDDMIKELKEKIELLESIRGKKGKKGRKEEQRKDICTSINDYVKFVVFRTTKFAAPGEELTLATQKVWEGIKDKKRLEKGQHKLTKDDFIEIYDSAVSAALSDQRQYVQTRTSNCTRGK